MHGEMERFISDSIDMRYVYIVSGSLCEEAELCCTCAGGGTSAVFSLDDDQQDGVSLPCMCCKCV